MSMVCTMPGTDTKVTPDREAPIMPNDTMYQGDSRFPRKKASLSEWRLPAHRETQSSRPKYSTMVSSINIPFIS